MGTAVKSVLNALYCLPNGKISIPPRPKGLGFLEVVG
jgi:hypothetical protein